MTILANQTTEKKPRRGDIKRRRSLTRKLGIEMKDKRPKRLHKWGNQPQHPFQTFNPKGAFDPASVQ